MTPTQKLIEAAEAAVEALTNCASEHGHRCNRCDSEVDEGGRAAEALRTAIRDLRRAQERPEAAMAANVARTYAKYERLTAADRSNLMDCIDTLEAAALAALRTALQGLREAQAEPAAWIGPVWQLMSHDVFMAWRDKYPDQGHEQFRPLYATPPTTDAPAQGVALTDEQKAEAAWGYAEDHKRLSERELGLIESVERAVWAANGIAAPTQEGAPK